MISGGNATVYVANMDAAVQFYSQTLGLTLTNRFGRSIRRRARPEESATAWKPTSPPNV